MNFESIRDFIHDRPRMSLHNVHMLLVNSYAMVLASSYIFVKTIAHVKNNRNIKLGLTLSLNSC